MRIQFIFMAIWSLLLLGFSLFIACIHFYAFTLPFIIGSFCSFLLAMMGVLKPKKQQTIFPFSVILFALLVVPWIFAVIQWPGDDDAGGIGWGFVVGGGTFIATLFGFFLLMHHLAKRLHIKQV